MLKLLTNKEFVKFIFAGGIAAAANFFSRMLFGLVLNYPISIVCAYLVGMVVAYFLFKIYVFPPGQHSDKKQVQYFVLINIGSILLILVTSLFFYYYVFFFMKDIFWRESSAHFIGMAVTTITSYFGHKYLTFQ